LQNIAEHIRIYQPAKEQRFITEFIDKAEDLLSSFPHMGQLIDTLSSARQEFRTLLLYKHYRLLYEVDTDEDVSILQIIDLRSEQEFYR
jgi:plasmid stabilization system protein ParE